jgi:hypothetical protein
MALRRGSLAVIAVAAMAAGASPGLADPACFSAADNARLDFAVIEQAPPPAPHSRRPYAYYPQTGVTTKQIAALARAPRGLAGYYYHWANRSNAALTGANGAAVSRKLNFAPSMDGRRRQRTAFTSVARANACTLAQAASLLGHADQAARLAAGQGMTVVSEAQAPDVGEAGPADRCVVAAGTLPAQATGIVLDYEVQDGRDPATTERFLKAYAELVHAAGRHAILLVNPLDSPGEQKFTGVVAANASRIVALFDRTLLVVWSGNVEHSLADSYAAQMAIVRAGGPVDTRRLLIDFELAGTTIEDARFVHAAIMRDKLGGVLFWRNHARQGGDCNSAVNQRIAAVAWGTDTSRTDARVQRFAP